MIVSDPAGPGLRILEDLSRPRELHLATHHSQLVAALSERLLAPGTVPAHIDDRHQLSLASHGDGFEAFEVEPHLAHGRRHAGPQDPTDRRRLHEPGCNVGCVADRCVLTSPVVANLGTERQSRCHPDPCAGSQATNLERTADGPLLVILMRHGCAERHQDLAPLIAHVDLLQVPVQLRNHPDDVRRERTKLVSSFASGIVEPLETHEEHGRDSVLVDEPRVATTDPSRDGRVEVSAEQPRERRRRLAERSSPALLHRGRQALHPPELAAEPFARRDPRAARHQFLVRNDLRGGGEMLGRGTTVDRAPARTYSRRTPRIPTVVDSTSPNPSPILHEREKVPALVTTSRCRRDAACMSSAHWTERRQPAATSSSVVGNTTVSASPLNFPTLPP